MALLNCLRRELKVIENDPPPLCEARPVDPSKDMIHQIGWVDGPQDTPYVGCRFHFTIDLPSDYPFKPPEIRFTTPVYHPNISTNGEIGLNILHSQWSPALNIRGLLLLLCSLLAEPNSEYGLNEDALKLYQTNREKYNETARKWTRECAMESNN